MSLRVLIFCAAPKVDAGGVQAVVGGLAGWLRGRGHEVVVAWPDGEEGPGEWRLDLEAGPGPGAKAKGATDLARLAWRVRRFAPDVVNLHFVRGQTLYFVVLARLLGFRLVLSCHGSDLRAPTEAVRRAMPRFFRAADAVTVVAPDLAGEVAGHAPDAAVTVIPNGVDTAFWTPDDETVRDATLIVAAGRLTRVKGFDLLLDAVAKKGAEAGGDLRLVVAGEGEERAALEARASALGLTDRVAFVGHRSREELRDLYRQAGLFVLSSRQEGMPLALLEAMACGAPVVAAAVGGVPAAASGGAGTLVPAGDAAALAEAIGQERSGRTNAAGRLAAQRHDEAVAYARYEDVLAGAPC